MADVLLGENLNRKRRIFDKNLELRNISDGEETSTASETGINVEVRKLLEYVCVVYVTACDGTTGDETYTLTVQVSNAVGGTYTTIGTLAWPRATTGSNVIALSGLTAEVLDSDADWVRITATLAGTTPSITYGAYLAPAAV